MIVGLTLVGVFCIAAAISIFCSRPSQTVLVDDRPAFMSTQPYRPSYAFMGSTMGYGYYPFSGFSRGRYDTPPAPRRTSNRFTQQRVVGGNLGRPNAPPPYNPTPIYNAPPPRVQQTGGFAGGSSAQGIRLS